MVRNRAMFMVASNAYSIVPADMGDRRWMVLDVGNGRIQDHEYFAAIHAELDAGGREAMLYDLLKRDISKGPNPRRILFTDARITQILVSEAPYIRMLHSLLDQGRLPQNWLVAPNVTTVMALLHELQTRYGDRHMSDTALGRLVREVIPDLKSRVNGHYVVGFSNGDAIKERSTELIFPPLSEARQAFDRQIGAPVNWSNDLDDWQPDPMNADQSASRDGDDLP